MRFRHRNAVAAAVMLVWSATALAGPIAQGHEGTSVELKGFGIVGGLVGAVHEPVSCVRAGKEYVLDAKVRLQQGVTLFPNCRLLVSWVSEVAYPGNDGRRATLDAAAPKARSLGDRDGFDVWCRHSSIGIDVGAKLIAHFRRNQTRIAGVWYEVGSADGGFAFMPTQWNYKSAIKGRFSINFWGSV